MKVVIAAHRRDETEIFNKVNEKFGFELEFCSDKISDANREMAARCEALAVNAACKINADMAAYLKEAGVKYLLTRTAGVDHIDMKAVGQLGIRVANVPAYSPNAISEHTVMMILAILRKLKVQLQRVKDQYFLIQGLRGKELRMMTVGVIGAGRIGASTIRNLSGFGCKILAYDTFHREDVKQYAQYVTKEELLRQADIVVLHCPLIPENEGMICADTISVMKDGAILVNTARGGLVDTKAVYEALISGKLSGFAMDVYEQESLTQRKDLRGKELPDPLLASLLSMDNVLFTSHTAFYTDEAIENIVDITLTNLHEFVDTGNCKNEVKA